MNVLDFIASVCVLRHSDYHPDYYLDNSVPLDEAILMHRHVRTNRNKRRSERKYSYNKL